MRNWKSLFLSFLNKFKVSEGMIIPYGLSWEKINSEINLLLQFPLFLTIDEEWDDFEFNYKSNQLRMLQVLIKIGSKNNIRFALIPIGE